MSKNFDKLVKLANKFEKYADNGEHKQKIVRIDDLFFSHPNLDNGDAACQSRFKSFEEKINNSVQNFFLEQFAKKPQKMAAKLTLQAFSTNTLPGKAKAELLVLPQSFKPFVLKLINTEFASVMNGMTFDTKLEQVKNELKEVMTSDETQSPLNVEIDAK